MKRFTVFIVLVLLTTGPHLVMGQSAGMISGKITDAKTGSPLPGANVLLKGTSLGAASDLDGNYVIGSVPAGSYTVRVSYIGYRNREVLVRVKKGERVTEDVKLEAVAVKGHEVVVTAQALGQNEAINQQLASNKIVDVVSAARIQELPDANAAESVGRLPGVYLLRSGGEGYEVAIRGLAPKYNEITIDGVEMPPTAGGDRSVDMSMISSNMLSSIELYKTVTPDMDAAVLGGVVNFQIAEAKRTPSGAPEIDLSAQGGYDNLQNAYDDYKFTGAVGERFLNDRLGVLAQAAVENVNLTSEGLGVGYTMLTYNYGQKNPLELTSLGPSYSPAQRQRYDATLTLDYKLPEGKIDFMNFFSSAHTNSQGYSQSYGLTGDDISYGYGEGSSTLEDVTNLLDYRQRISSFDIDVRLSNAFTQNVNPGSWSVGFFQGSAGLNYVPTNESPVMTYELASAKTNLDNMYFNGLSTSNSFTKHRALTGSVDVQRSFTLSDLITGTLKFGGMYKYSSSYYDYNDGSGTLYFVTDQGARTAVIEAFPWMAQPPYNLDATQPFPIAAFLAPGFNYKTVLGGRYKVGTPVNLGLISQVINTVVETERGLPETGNGTDAYLPDVFGSGASDYSGNEYQSAGYIMATLNIGPQVAIIPGVRYQALETSYRAPWYFDASAVNPYPYSLPHQDTTMNEYHGYWLPDVIVRYKPFSWFDVRASYTNTISYPDPSQITPVIDIWYNTNTVNWHNSALKPARSRNYDLAFSLYDNSIGLLSVDGFLKQINDLIFGSGTIYISNPSEYSGLPANTRGFQLSTSINNPYQVNLWGTEFDWQTHFWYLPGPLSGLVANVNYTHIFSGAHYPYRLTIPGKYPTFIVTYVDTFYTDRLIDQPNDIVNFSAGYDFKGFSAVVSLIYQANVFNGTSFWPELRSYKAKYVRWDLALKQTLPWPGLEAYFDLNNINGASDTYVIQGTGFPTSETDYGMTADLGLRWRMQ